MIITETIPISIKFVLEKRRKGLSDGSRVYAQVLFKREKALVSMGMTVDSTEWDQSIGLLRSTTNFNARANVKLREARDKIIEIYTTLRSSGTPISAKAIKQSYSANKLRLDQYCLPNTMRSTLPKSASDQMSTAQAS
jgi:hypothetical protein